MAGTNPDGSHYNDPGIRWISYFNHGEAIHAFNRLYFARVGRPGPALSNLLVFRKRAARS